MSTLKPILEVAAVGPFTVRGLSERLGWSYATAHHRVFALLDMGLLQRELFEDDHGRHYYVYALSPLGVEFVQSGGIS